MKKILPYLMVAMTGFGVPLEHLNLQQNVDAGAMNAISQEIAKTNTAMIIGLNGKSVTNIPPERLMLLDGILFDIYEDGEVNFFFNEMPDEMSPLERMKFNGSSLKSLIDGIVEHKVKDVLALTVTGIARNVSADVVAEHVYNPLWGKKLAVIGDSLISTPRSDTSYVGYVAQRNNMTLVHKGRSGEMLCKDRPDNPACINSYTNDIPSDADFILCQIGANDSNFVEADDDTDMTTNTFKGCWNNLLIGLKKNYPNAKIGMILANNWTNNVGFKSEDTTHTTANYRRRMTQWQKSQCQRLNIPVFDPVEDTRKFTYNYVTYPTNGTTIMSSHIDESELSWFDKTKLEIGTAQSTYSENGYWIFQSQFIKDTQHTTKSGNIYLSYFYEAWMKTEVASSY